MQCLTRYSEDREADIERIGLTKHEEFLDSVSRLQHVREGTVNLTAEILKLNQSIQASTEKLAEQKGALVNTKAIRQNIADATDALKDSLQVFMLSTMHTTLSAARSITLRSSHSMTCRTSTWSRSCKIATPLNIGWPMSSRNPFLALKKLSRKLS